MALMNQVTLGLDPLPKKTRKEFFLEEMNPLFVAREVLRALVQSLQLAALSGIPFASGVCFTQKRPLAPSPPCSSLNPVMQSNPTSCC